MDHQHDHACGHHHFKKSVSWGAILAGALVGVGLSFLLNLLGFAIGLTAFPASSDGTVAFAAGGFVGLAIISIISMFFCGWVAGYLARPSCKRRNLGEIYGFTAWTVALIIAMYLTTHIGQFLSNATFMVNRNAPVVIFTVDQNKAAMTTTSNASTTTTSTSTATDAAGMVGLAAFLLFFLGAISACLGGRVGMTHKKRDDFSDTHC